MTNTQNTEPKSREQAKEEAANDQWRAERNQSEDESFYEEWE